MDAVGPFTPMRVHTLSALTSGFWTLNACMPPRLPSCNFCFLFSGSVHFPRIALAHLLGKDAATASTGTPVVRIEPDTALPALPFFEPWFDDSAPPSLFDLSTGSSESTSTGSSLSEQTSVYVRAPFTDPFGLSSGLLQAQGTASAVIAATVDAPFTLFGFSRAELYAFFDTGEEIAGNTAFISGVATLVTANPLVAGVTITAKVTQAALAVGKIAFSENPLNELVEVGVSFVVGRAGGAAAGQAFRAARRAGLVDSAVSLASRTQACRFTWAAPRAVNPNYRING